MIENAIIDNHDGTYIINFFSGVNFGIAGKPASIAIDRQLPAQHYADYTSVLWPALLEKAFALINPLVPHPGYENYSWMDGIFSGIVMGTFTGSAPNWWASTIDVSQFESAYNAGWFLCLGSNLTQPAGSPIVADHDYSELDYDHATQLMRLKNPWGFDQWIHWNDVATYFQQIEAMRPKYKSWRVAKYN